MRRTIFPLTLAFVIMLSGCGGISSGAGDQAMSAETETSAVPGTTAMIPPSSTPTEPPTPTATTTPSPTPDPIQPFLGVWLCEGCVTMERLEISDTGSGLELHTWWTGAQHDWIGPTRCESVHLPYYECSVSAAPDGTLNAHYVMHNPYFTDMACFQVVDLGFQMQDDVIMLTGWDASIMQCEEGGPNPVGYIHRWSVMEGRPWPGWHMVE